MLRDLLTSKKFIATIAGVVTAAAARKGLNMSEADTAMVLGMFATYVAAQGAADHGKERAKIMAAGVQLAEKHAAPVVDKVLHDAGEALSDRLTKAAAGVVGKVKK